MDLPGVDLIVVNYKTADDLIGLGASIERHCPVVPMTVYIMNNEPEVSDIRAAAQFRDMVPVEVEIVSQPNIYYSGACNMGAQLSRREVMAFFNSDTRLKDGTIDKCYAALMENPSWGVLGPLQYGDRGEVTHAGIFGTNSAPKHRGWLGPVLDEYRDVREAVTVSGSALFTKRSVWREMLDCGVYHDLHPDVGGAFLPTTHYYEETWYCYHVASHGYKVMYFGEAEMVHRWHKSSTRGGWADQQMPISRQMFRAACDAHGIERD